MARKDNAIVFSKRKISQLIKDGKLSLIKRNFNLESKDQEEEFYKALDYSFPLVITESPKEWYESWLMIDDEHKIDTVCFLDAETSHLNGFCISIALITVDLHTLTIVDDKSKYFEFNPQVTIDPETIPVHGFTDEMVKDFPLFESAIDEMAEILNYSELKCAFNSMYDIGVVYREWRRCDLPQLTEMSQMDLMLRLKQIVKAKNSAGHIKNPKLEECADFYRLQYDPEVLHNAFEDTKLTVKVFLESIK